MSSRSRINQVNENILGFGTKSLWSGQEHSSCLPSSAWVRSRTTVRKSYFGWMIFVGLLRADIEVNGLRARDDGNKDFWKELSFIRRVEGRFDSARGFNWARGDDTRGDDTKVVCSGCEKRGQGSKI